MAPAVYTLTNCCFSIFGQWRIWQNKNELTANMWRPVLYGCLTVVNDPCMVTVNLLFIWLDIFIQNTSWGRVCNLSNISNVLNSSGNRYGSCSCSVAHFTKFCNVLKLLIFFFNKHLFYLNIFLKMIKEYFIFIFPC